MAEITATKNPSDLHDVLGKVNKVFYNKAVNTAPSTLTGTFDFKLPILDESVTFNMGTPDVVRTKLIDQTNWTSYAKKGDPDISFQVPSFSDEIASLLGNKIGESTTNAGLATKFQGYSTSPKKTVGSLLFVSEDGLVCIYLPNVEIYSTAVMGDGDNPAYFNSVITPLPDGNGADYYIGIKNTENSGS